MGTTANKTAFHRRDRIALRDQTIREGWYGFFVYLFMTEEYFTIQFHHNGLDYNGRVSPEKKDTDGHYVSWHVVLNEIFFGYLSHQNGKWECTEWRPEDLVAIVGREIEYRISNKEYRMSK